MAGQTGPIASGAGYRRHQSHDLAVHRAGGRPGRGRHHADERQDHRQPARQVHQPVEQPGHQEEQRPQAQQGERVGREDDVGLIGDAEHGRDRVHREQEVRAADGDEHDEQWRDHSPAAAAGDQPATGVGVADRQYPPRQANQRIVPDVGVLVMVAVQPHGRPEQQQSEDQEHEGEQRQEGRAQGDEDRSQGQGGDDAEDEHPLLVLAGHRERRHDDHEDEEVVEGQARFHDVAGEVLSAVSPPRPGGEDQAENARHRDVEHRPGGSLPVADSVRTYGGQEQVQGEQRQDHPDCQGPAERGNPHS